jgi:HAD superfamily hydrolase (TIGR01509 family)
MPMMSADTGTSGTSAPPTTKRVGVALDIDGTLVDSTYHHTICWLQAFQQYGYRTTAARVHAHIGMGGDQLVQAVAGREAERDHGDDLRASHDALFAVLLPTIQPLAGAERLLEAFSTTGQRVVLCSSASAWETEHYIDLLGARDVLHGWTTSDDVTHTKPHGDLVRVARERLDSPHAIMVGDSPWDVRAASAAGTPAVGVDTGGFGADALRAAGARLVVSCLDDLLDRVNCEPFIRWRGGLERAERAAARPGPDTD